MKAKAFWQVAVCGVLAAASCSSGCSGGPKPTAKNFEKTLNAYFADHNECLFSSAPRFPYEVSPGSGKEDQKRMDALAGAGLLEKQRDPEIKADRYSLTAMGSRVGGRFCYGHRVVSGIDGFTPPAKQNGFLETTVDYRYTMMDVPVWVKTDAMAKAFPEMAQKTSGAGVGKTVLGATGAGWEVVE